MKYIDIKKYVEELWSPGKILLIIGALHVYLWGKFSSIYYTHCNYVPDHLQKLICDEAFVGTYIRPISLNSTEILVLISVLALLPFSHLYRWLKYIGSWSLPLGIGLFLLGSDGTSAPSMIGPGLFNHTGMLQIAVYSWLILLTGYILWSITAAIVATYRTK